jgi:hypothetical protein
MSEPLFKAMCAKALAIMKDEWKLDLSKDVELVSGGAAWADHVAVQLFLDNQVKSLTVYLPCAWDEKRQAAKDTGQYDWRINPGRTMNSLHRWFSKRVGRNTLAELTLAKTKGATLDCSHKGFHARNTAVATKCTHAIAFTWGSDTATPKDGGTLHTWFQMPQSTVKRHVPLASLLQTGPR